MSGLRRARAALVVGLVLLALPWAGRPAAAAGTAAPTLQLVAQTPFVAASGTFSADLHVPAAAPGDTVQVTAYSRLTSRSDFSQALAGKPDGASIWYQGPLAVIGGAVRVQIPVNEPVPARMSGTYEFHAYSGSAVYPLAFQLYDRNAVPVGGPLTTFLVYSSTSSAAVPRLAVSLTVPVGGPVDRGPAITPLPAAATSALTSLASALAASPSVPVTLAVQPEVLDRLAAGGSAGRQVLASLAASTPADQVLAAPYYPVDGAALYAANMVSALQVQYGAGAAALAAALGRQPDAAAAVVTGGLDDSGLSALLSMGARRMVVPAGDLSPLSAEQQQITFANPTSLEGGKGTTTTAVAAADSGLSAFLTPKADPVLAGEQLLAGLSLVQLEAPSDARGIALLPPPGTGVDPTVLATLLAGLDGNPLLAPATVDRYFAEVPAASPLVTRTLVDQHQAAPLPGADALRAAGAALDGLATIVPSDGRSVAPLQRQLLYASSSAVTGAGRAAITARIQAAVKKAEAGISLPGSSSITLTARTGTIPLTVLSSPSLHARVRLVISSAKLAFRPFATALGTCTVADESTETCQLTLTSEATTLRVPVETRTSGVFSMQVTLLSPDGAVVLAANRDTVRSTAFSEVGVFLIVAAALGLLVWWVRNARHGRRARQLVEPPDDDGVRLPDLDGTDEPARPDGPAQPAEPSPPPQPALAQPVGLATSLPPFPVAAAGAPPAVRGDVVPEPGPPPAEPPPDGDGGGAGWLDEDPIISEFFSSPAPDYGQRAGGGTTVSPSGRRRGPNS